jgi:hypothetical protein
MVSSADVTNTEDNKPWLVDNAILVLDPAKLVVLYGGDLEANAAVVADAAVEPDTEWLIE